MGHKIFITDLDDTLLASNARLKEENVVKINRMIEDGLLFTYITARDFISSREIMKDVNINIPVAISNGAALADMQTGFIREYSLMNKLSVERLIWVAREYSLIPNLIVIHNQILKNCYVCMEQHLHKEQYERNLSAYPDMTLRIDNISSIDVSSVISMSFLDKREKAASFYKRLCQENIKGISVHYFLDVKDSQVGILEIEPDYVSKGSAAKKILEQVFPDKVVEIVAFGNGVNDVSLLQCAEKSVAVGDVPNCLKQCADVFLAYEDGDSVVSYIQKEFYKNNPKGKEERRR